MLIKDSVAMDPSKTEVECMACDAHQRDSSFLYDFCILYAEIDKDLAERIFSILEKQYDLRGYHKERNVVAGKAKLRHLRKAWQKTQFIIQLVSPRSSEDRCFERWRSVANELECDSGEPCPAVVPIFINLPRDQQRQQSTTVGLVFSDDRKFYDALVSYMRRICDECNNVEIKEKPVKTNGKQICLNNNNPVEEQSSGKPRKKRKVFTGLFKAKNKTSRSSKSQKARSKKKRKTFRKLFMCIPSKSDPAYTSDSVESHQVSVGQSAHIARIQDICSNTADEDCTVTRIETQRS